MGGMHLECENFLVDYSTLETASELHNDHAEKFSFFVLSGATAVFRAAVDEKCLFSPTILFRRNTSSIFFFS